MNTLENLLVWSSHRAKTLGRCARQYYYSYIGSWEGWDASAEPEVQMAYRLKHLTSAELEIGQIVHEQIRVILAMARSGSVIHPATHIEIAQKKFETFVQCSATRRLEELSAKRRKLFCHETGQGFTPQELADGMAKIARLLEGFLSFDDVQLLLAEPARLIPELLDPPGFEVGDELGVPARPKTDAVFLTDDAVVVSDWKTGGPREDHRTQGLVYDLFIRKKLNLTSADKVEVRFYYLGERQVMNHTFSDDERTEALWLIGEQFGEMRSLSDDPKVNCGPESRFHPHVSRGCYGCNHRLMCEPFLASKLARSTPTAP